MISLALEAYEATAVNLHSTYIRALCREVLDTLASIIERLARVKVHATDRTINSHVLSPKLFQRALRDASVLTVPHAQGSIINGRRELKIAHRQVHDFILGTSLVRSQSSLRSPEKPSLSTKMYYVDHLFLDGNCYRYPLVPGS